MRSIFKKSALIGLLGLPYDLILWVTRTLSAFKQYGVGGVYDCGISVEVPCSLLSYIFTSGTAFIFYYASIRNFIVLFSISAYLFYLVRNYKNGNIKTFLGLVLIGVFMALATYFYL